MGACCFIAPVLDFQTYKIYNGLEDFINAASCMTMGVD